MSKDLLIDLLRHGEVEGHGKIHGATDVPLTSRGKQQMEQATLNGEWDVIYSSPLQRCALFAHELGQKREIPVHVENRLAELDFGAWEDAEISQIMATNPGLVESYWNDPTSSTPEGGENITAFSNRVAEAVSEIKASTESEQILIVAHGGVIRVILAWVLNMQLSALMRIEVGHGSMSRIRIPGKGNPSLVFHGGGALC